MPSVNDYFGAVLAKLEPPDYYDGLVESACSELTDRLKTFVGVQKVFVVGSHQKRTLIAPLPDARLDVDVFAVVSNSLYYAYNTRRNGQSQLLQYVRQSLSRFPYERIVIKRNGRGITLVLPEFDMNVIPAFALTAGGYYILDGHNGGRWITTYPEQQEDELTRFNTLYSNTLKPLIKLLKAWSRARNLPLNGYMIEVIAENYLRTLEVNHYSYQSLVADFLDKFDHGRVSALYRQTEDVLSPLTEAEKAAIKQKLVVSSTDAKYARDAEARELPDHAIQYWKRVFGIYSS